MCIHAAELKLLVPDIRPHAVGIGFMMVAIAFSVRKLLGYRCLQVYPDPVDLLSPSQTGGSSAWLARQSTSENGLFLLHMNEGR